MYMIKDLEDFTRFVASNYIYDSSMCQYYKIDAIHVILTYKDIIHEYIDKTL
jgi:hypothetical protein